MKKYIPIFLSLLLLGGGIALDQRDLAWFQADSVRFAWYLLAFLPVGFPVLKEAVEHVSQKEYFNEFMLMSLATMGAFYIGEYPEGVSVMLFYAIGEIFQDQAVDKSLSYIQALLDVRPRTTTVIRRGKTMEESPENVAVGETVEVKAGERVPLDGEMEDEVAAFDTSALTGESVPRHIRKSETVLAGMIVMDKTVKIKVTKSYDQSALTQVLELVQNATERKAPTELFIRKFARMYTPVVTGLSVLIVLFPFLYSLIQPEFTFIFNKWLYRALVFLVISCPCALMVSIPLSYFGGIGAASRHGILFKGGNYLDAITQVNTIVFDKTGTLTKGIFKVQAIKAAEDFTPSKLLETVASVESRSAHPIAQAILHHATKAGVYIHQDLLTEEIAGYGLNATCEGKKVLVGNTRLLDIHGILYPSGLADIPGTLVVCAVDGEYKGHLVIADSLKEDARSAIESLRALNIHHMEILSGDKQAIVSQVATELGIENAYGDLLPEEKVRHIEKLKTWGDHCVAFVGDGINDVPVLALSDLGIAMGGLGSDMAIETANVIIQTDCLAKIATAIQIGRATHRVVWQNILIAFGIKLAILVLGATGMATMWEAVSADVGVALLAILNAIRVQRKSYF